MGSRERDNEDTKVRHGQCTILPANDTPSRLKDKGEDCGGNDDDGVEHVPGIGEELDRAVGVDAQKQLEQEVGDDGYRHIAGGRRERERKKKRERKRKKEVRESGGGLEGGWPAVSRLGMRTAGRIFPAAASTCL